MGSTMDFISATLTDAVAPKFRRPVEDIIYETIDRKQIPTRTDFQELRNTIDALRSQSTGTSSGIIKIKTGLDELEELVHDLQNQIVDLSRNIEALTQQNQELALRIDSVVVLTNIENQAGSMHDDIQDQTLDAVIQLGAENAISTSELHDMLQHVIAHNQQLEQDNRNLQNATALLLQRIELLESKPEAQPSNISKKSSKKEATEEKTVSDKSDKNTDKNKSCTIDDCTESARGFGFCNKHYNKWRRYTLGDFVTYEGTVRWKDQIITVPDIYKGKPFTVEADNSVWVEGEQIALL